MAKSTDKRVTVNALERVVKEYAAMGQEWATDVIVTWAGMGVTVHRVLPLQTMMEFVERVAKSCFDTETGEYIPEVKDFAIRSNILDTYANFTLPKNIDQQYRFVYGTDAVDIVLQNVSQKQFKEILRAIDAKIEYLVRTDIERIRHDVANAVQAINDIATRFSALMEWTAPGDVERLLSSIGKDGAFDEEKLVKAFLSERNTQKESAGDATSPTPVTL